MDADSWAARLSSASKRYQAALHSRSDLFMGFDEIEEEDVREEFACPFCLEYSDIVSLCCHIDDEHPVECKNGVCPVCSMRVGIDMVSHITLHHGNVFKMQRKRRALSKGGGSASTLSLLRRELRDGNLQSLLLGGSSSSSSSSSCTVNAGPDPLLSSFIMPMVDNFGSSTTRSSPLSVSKKIANENVSEERGAAGGGGGGVVAVQQCSHVPPLSIKDQEEKSRRSAFVRGMLMSTIFDDEDGDFNL